MWVSKAEYLALHRDVVESHSAAAAVATRMQTEVKNVAAANARLQADLDWFKHRLNQVERERGQLIQAALGVKVSIPEFQVKGEGSEAARALAEQPDFSTIGGEAKDEESFSERQQLTPAIQEGVHYDLPTRAR